MEPSAYIAYLDAVTALEDAKAYKRQTFALLNLNAGSRVLDAGCGAGDDAIVLARLVGPGGEVVGLDASEAMIATARQRAEGSGLPVTFRTGDIHDLDFPDGSFDGARTDRVMQHLPDPARALAELVRVTRPGGRVVVSDPDWETLIVDASDPDLTRRILGASRADTRNYWMGRHLRGLFVDAGLVELAVVPVTAVLTEFAPATAVLHLREAADVAVAIGTVPAAQAAGWIEELERADQEGRFFSAMTGFIVAGTRPGGT
jgi:ubiquinone/menaquinone biosynthesis C-methylase UbiE